MFTIQIPASLIRGAMACQAKKDVRFYLNGILLASNGDVVGTNGHVMFKGNSAEHPDADTIVQIDGKIPDSATHILFDFDALICKTEKGKVFSFSIITDCTYPQYNRVIPALPRTNHATGFSCNASKMAKVETAFGKDAIVSVYPATENDSIIFTYQGKDETLENSVFVLMPCRAGEFEPLYKHEDIKAIAEK